MLQEEGNGSHGGVKIQRGMWRNNHEWYNLLKPCGHQREMRKRAEGQPSEQNDKGKRKKKV